MTLERQPEPLRPDRQTVIADGCRVDGAFRMSGDASAIFVSRTEADATFNHFTRWADDRCSCEPMKVYIKHSDLAGNGLFAGEFIPWGARIIQYTGEIIGDAEAAQRAAGGADAIFEVGPDKNIDGRVGGSGAEFANHSRVAANAFVLRENDEIWLVAGIQGIHEGEEILYDYGTDYYD